MSPATSIYKRCRHCQNSECAGSHSNGPTYSIPTQRVLQSQVESHPSQFTPTSSDKRTPENLSTYQDNIMRCPEALRTAIRACTGNDFTALACVISLVMNSEQQLNVKALSEAVQMYMTYPELCWQSKRDVPKFEQWLRKFTSLLVITESGQVFFTESGMSDFLQTYPIRGIDASQKLIATLCLAQTEYNYNRARSQARSSGQDSAFSVYAAMYGHFHERVARQSSLFLSLQGFRGVSQRTSHGSPEFQTSRLTLRQKPQSIPGEVATEPERAEAIDQDWELV